MFLFFFFPRTDLTIDEVSHFISHKKFFNLLAQVECIVLVTYDPSERPYASSFLSQALALLTRASVIWVTEKFFFFFVSPSYKKLPWAHHSLFNFQPPTYASFISVHSYLRLSVSLGNCKTTDFITSSVCEISLKVKPSFSRTKRTLCIKESWRERSLIGYDFLRFWQSRSWMRVKIYEI